MINNFTLYLDEQIHLEMKLRSTTDPRRLNGFRNIKSDYIYNKEKFDKLSDSEIISKLYKMRDEASIIYEGKNEELRQQELIEMGILKPYLPKEIDIAEIFAFLESLNIQKTKINFKLFQEECEKKFGQKIDSAIILKFITG